MIKKLRARKTERLARQRHNRLMSAAEHLIREAVLKPTTSPEQVTATQVACLAFARHEMRIDEAEAADYLAAALVERGYNTDHMPAVPA
ncbi:hypothetical protein OG436_39310 (plasmid) [Streptomyces caniferus]|uniref:hypothetical protein n=1 Tax=Streptomyces caniferus TaxID=285557 RepID=UPI002E2A8327|nr:hypothetical protein [Streptomyces caniferus]